MWFSAIYFSYKLYIIKQEGHKFISYFTIMCYSL